MAPRKKITKVSGLKADGNPTAYWKRFKNRLDNYNATPIKDWTAENLLGHILYRFKEFNHIEFTLSYSGPPTKCKEIFCVKRMQAYLGTEDPKIAKDYIDWVYDVVIIPQKIDVSSIAFFFTGQFITKFKSEYRRNNNITRATKLPTKIESLAADVGAEVFTYGDLAFAKQALKADPDDYPEFQTLFVKLQESGFNEEILNNLD